MSNKMTRAKIDLIPDMFDASLLHVICDSEEAGTVWPQGSQVAAARMDGTLRIFPNQRSAIGFIQGKDARPEKTKPASSQYSLF